MSCFHRSYFHISTNHPPPGYHLLTSPTPSAFFLFLYSIMETHYKQHGLARGGPGATSRAHVTPHLIPALHPPARVLRSVGQSYNEVLLARFSPLYAQCAGSTVIELPSYSKFFSEGPCYRGSAKFFKPSNNTA